VFSSRATTMRVLANRAPVRPTIHELLGGMPPRAMCDLRMAFHLETSKPAWRRSLII
jgi:hypothetical protein